MEQQSSIYSPCSSAKITDLPVVVMEKIVNYLSYEEMSVIRQTCKFFQRYTERALNEGFFQLGKQISHSSASVKKLLPKKESERRGHPLNRYSEVFSALETRYTLLSMTYKKFIDLHHCCFIPGKVLDVAYVIVRQINSYLAQNTTVPLDVIQILRDIRDYSSMAMEHFDEHIAPRYPSRPLIPLFRTCSNTEPPSFMSQCCTITLTSGRSAGRQSVESILEGQSSKDNNRELLNSLRSEMRNKFEEQNRVIDEQRKVIKEQGFFIREIVEFLGEMGKQNEWTPRLMDNLNRLSLNYSSIGSESSSASTLTLDASKPKDLGVKRSFSINIKPQTPQEFPKRSLKQSDPATEEFEKPYFLRTRSNRKPTKEKSVGEERNLRKRKALTHTVVRQKYRRIASSKN